jgi:hypothetical protein
MYAAVLLERRYQLSCLQHLAELLEWSNQLANVRQRVHEWILELSDLRACVAPAPASSYVMHQRRYEFPDLRQHLYQWIFELPNLRPDNVR